jgi:hypothetical protein
MSNKRPRGDATPVKQYEDGKFRPYMYGPVQNFPKAKGPRKNKEANNILRAAGYGGSLKKKKSKKA